MPLFADLDADSQAVCRRMVVTERGDLLRDVRGLTARRHGPDPVETTWAILEQIGRDPRPWSRQLVTLRAVQTLSVLDLALYCNLVANLGDYEDADV